MTHQMARLIAGGLCAIASAISLPAPDSFSTGFALMHGLIFGFIGIMLILGGIVTPIKPRRHD